MSKANIILKKANLFEKLSKCENKKAMLKIMADENYYPGSIETPQTQTPNSPDKPKQDVGEFTAGYGPPVKMPADPNDGGFTAGYAPPVKMPDSGEFTAGYSAPVKMPPQSNKPTAITTTQATNVINVAKSFVAQVSGNPYLSQQQKNKLSWLSKTLRAIPTEMYDANVHALKGQIDNLLSTQTKV